jgi:MoaA/NifB/PqqE/SkfB family radical SAM enzyme
MNYSGESTVYPDLIPAIRLAREQGAYVELVSALTPASDSLLEDLSRSGLNRLSVSVHAAEDRQFREIYRYGDFEAQRWRLKRFVGFCRNVANPPLVDFSFVAMDRNLDQLGAVVTIARELGVEHVVVFPVVRRDDIPVQFPVELYPSGAPAGFRFAAAIRCRGGAEGQCRSADYARKSSDRFT